MNILHLFWKVIKNREKWLLVVLNPSLCVSTVVKIPFSPEFTVSLKKISIKMQHYFLFFTRNCYLCAAAHISFSPEIAILSAPHRWCHQLVLSQCAPHLKFTRTMPQVNQIFAAPRYICPISCRCKYFDRPPANRYLISELR